VLTFTLCVLNYCVMTTTPTARDSSLNAQVAAEIRAWMGRREMNQADLARALGENEMWVMRRVRGRQQMTIADLQRLAEVLHVSVLDLFPSRGSGSGGKINNLNASLPRLSRSAHVPTAGGGSPFPRTGNRPSGHPRKNVTRPGSPVPATRRRPVPVQPPKPPSLRTALPMTA